MNVPEHCIDNDVLLAEYMQDGLTIDRRLRNRNPFVVRPARGRKA